MLASPIIPGRVYRVHHDGQTYTVTATNPWGALAIVLGATQC